MTVATMQKHFTFPGPDEVVLLIRYVDAVAVDSMQAILVRKTIQPKNATRVDRLDSSRVQIWVKLNGLDDRRLKRLPHDCGSYGRLVGNRSIVFRLRLGHSLCRLSAADPNGLSCRC